MSIGLQQDQICNMASISVVLLGLNPDTRLRTVVDYLKARGVPAAEVPDVVLKHPRMFEYKVGRAAMRPRAGGGGSGTSTPPRRAAPAPHTSPHPCPTHPTHTITHAIPTYPSPPCPR